MPLLTPEQIEEIRQIIRDGSTAVAISTMGMEVPEEELQRLVDEGYVDPDDLRNFVLDSYEYGRLMAQLPAAKDMSYAQFRSRVSSKPVEMTPDEKRALEFAEHRAGQFCVGLGVRASGDVTPEVVSHDQALLQRHREGIKEKVSESIAQRKTLSELKSALGHIAEDWARDWKRIANTESHLAHQQGVFERVIAEYGDDELLAKMPEPGACDDCKRLYLDKDGNPKIRPASWWAEQGVANIGLKRSDWKPVLGAVHPHCQCSLVRVPRGFAFNEEMELVPESMIEKATKTPGGTFGGSSGYQVGGQAGELRVGPVGRMSMHGNDPVRTPGDDPFKAQLQEEHPGNDKQRKKRKKKKRTKEPEEEQQRMKDTGQTLRNVKGSGHGADTYSDNMNPDPSPDVDQNKEWLADEAQRRTDIGQRTRNLVLRPNLFRERKRRGKV